MELSFRVTDTPVAQESVLTFLLDNAGEEFTELQASVALVSLLHQQFASVRRLGRTGAFSANFDNPLIRQMKIARATFRAQAALEPILDLTDLAILFGSASRGEDRADSDIDLLVVTRDIEAVRHALAAHPRVQGVVITPEEHMAMIADKSTFAAEAARGIKLWGI
jgi:predicted nucleotidyltransferase